MTTIEWLTLIGMVLVPCLGGLAAYVVVKVDIAKLKEQVAAKASAECLAEITEEVARIAERLSQKASTESVKLVENNVAWFREGMAELKVFLNAKRRSEDDT